MKGRFAAILMAVLLLVYLVLVAGRAFMLMTSGIPLGIAMGLALIVLPAIGAWALGRELLFGMHAEELGKQLHSEGGMPADHVTTRASGRPVRNEADALFPKYREEVDAAPASWRAWFRLGLAYDASGDRRRGRQAVRHAIDLYRSDMKNTARGDSGASRSGPSNSGPSISHPS